MWSHIQRTSSGEWFRTIGELELSLPQLKTMYRLLGGDEPTVKELAEALGLSLAATSRGVDGLVRRGLLERREDAVDRRAKRVRLTPQGRQMITRVNEARLAGLADFVATLDPERREALAAALHPIVKDLTP